jgi:hypothetical protein
MSEPFPAWRCIGCGRIEAPQPCVGICHDRRVELVFASEHRETERVLAAAARERDALIALVRRLAWSRPRDDEWQRSYRVLQAQARELLAALAGGNDATALVGPATGAAR